MTSCLHQLLAPESCFVKSHCRFEDVGTKSSVNTLVRTGPINIVETRQINLKLSQVKDKKESGE